MTTKIPSFKINILKILGFRNFRDVLKFSWYSENGLGSADRVEI